MVTRILTLICLWLPSIVSSETWKVFGIDTVTHDCKTYPDITVFNDTLWAGLLKLDGETITSTEAPAMLFKCDVSAADNRGNIWFVGSISPDIWSTHGKSFTVYKYNGTEWFDHSPPVSFEYAACSSIAFQGDSNVWFATIDNGAFMFDGTRWRQYVKQTVFEGANAMAIDHNGNQWFATKKGLIRLEKDNWTVYNSSNSGLKFNDLTHLAIDNNGNIWLAASPPVNQDDTISKRLARFDGSNWIYYKPFENSKSSNNVNTIAIDTIGKVWVASSLGLSVFDAQNWKNFTYPSTLSPDLQGLSIDFATTGSILLGTTCGIWEFRDNNVLVKNSNKSNTVEIFPNPAFSHISIRSSAPNIYSDISITDIYGELVLKTRIYESFTQINISNLKVGSYFICINSQENRTIGKFVKK